MADLARAVTAVLRDAAVEDLLKENRDLQVKLKKFRDSVTEVSLDWVGPCSTEEDHRAEAEEFYESDDRNDGWFYWRRKIVSLEAGNEGERNGRLTFDDVGFIPMAIQFTRQSEIRIGSFYVTQIGDWNLSYYVFSVRRNRNSGLMEFTLYVVAEFAASSGETVSTDMELHAQNVSVEQYADLSGLTTEQVQAKFDIDRLETEGGEREYPAYFDRDGPWVRIEDLDRTPVQWDSLERIFGPDALFAVTSFDFSYDFVKNKALLL